LSLFSIVCESCASRLRVAKASAIGQILACPKCGTMIEIKPPADWEPPTQSSEKLAVPPPGPTSKSGTDFDDIESVLDSQAAQAEAIRKVRQQKTPTASAKQPPSKQKSATTKPTAGTDSSKATLVQPILPTDQWTAAATKRKRKVVTLIATVVGGLLLITAISLAVLNYVNRDPKVASVGTNDSSRSADSQDQQQPENEKSENPAADTEGTAAGQADANADADNNPSNQVPVAEDRGMTPAEPAAPTTADDISDPPAVLPEVDGASDSQVSDGSLDPNEEQQQPQRPINNLPPVSSPIGSSNPARNPARPNLTPLSDLEDSQSELGELSALLEQSNSSILEFQDLAAETRDQKMVGLAKYFIEKPDSTELTFSKQLLLPCDGVRYQDVGLVTVLREIGAITGVPISIHIDSIIANGGSPNPNISVDEKDLNFDQLVDKVIAPLGLAKSFSEDHGLLIHSAQFGLPIQRNHSLPDSLGKDPESARELMVAIQGLVFPQTWSGENASAQIELAANEFVVTNTAMAHYRIDQLISKINACTKLIQQPDNAEAHEVLRTHWDSISKELEKPLPLNRGPDTRLSSLLEKINNLTGLTVLVDWNSVAREGWNLDTVVPGYFDEPTVGEVLEEISRGLGCTLRAIDESTIEITSFEKAAWATDLEVYHFGKALAGPLNQQQALRLIRESLGNQLAGPQVREVYEPKYQCLVVVAPQSLQKQIESLIRQLESLGADP
jgi:hypothetical protein